MFKMPFVGFHTSLELFVINLLPDLSYGAAMWISEEMKMLTPLLRQDWMSPSPT